MEEFSKILDNYSLNEEHAYAIDAQGAIHFVDARNTEQLILYALTLRYPGFFTIVIDSGTMCDDVLAGMQVFGVFLDSAHITRENNYDSRLVIVPYAVFGPPPFNSASFERLQIYLLAYYHEMRRGLTMPSDEELCNNRPLYLYFDGLTDYLEYRQISQAFGKQHISTKWNQSAVVFIDTASYEANRAQIMRESLFRSIDFFLKDVPEDNVYHVESGDPILKHWTSSKREVPTTRFAHALETYRQICAIEEEYIVFTNMEILDNLIFASFAAAFITHGKKMIAHLPSQNATYEKYIFRFNEFEFGSLEQRISRLHQIGVENSVRVSMSSSDIQQLSVLRSVDYQFTYKVVELSKLLSLIDTSSGEPTYKTDADDFDSCGPIYSDCFDMGAVDNEGYALYSLVPILEALDIPFIQHIKAPTPGEPTPEHYTTLEYLNRVLRLVDQYVCNYSQYTTFRNLIIIQGPETSYIGVGNLEYLYRGDTMSLGSTDQYILQNVALPTQMYDHRIIFDFDEVGFKRILNAYNKHYYGNLPEGFAIQLAEVDPLTEQEIMMCLYWACDDEQCTVKFSADVGTHWCDMMLANSLNYRVYKYMYPIMFDKMKIFKPFGFRDFAVNDSPLNMFGGFNHSYDTSRQTYYVPIFQEAFRTFPGVVRRMENGEDIQD